MKVNLFQGKIYFIHRYTTTRSNVQLKTIAGVHHFSWYQHTIVKFNGFGLYDLFRLVNINR